MYSSPEVELQLQEAWGKWKTHVQASSGLGLYAGQMGNAAKLSVSEFRTKIVPLIIKDASTALQTAVADGDDEALATISQADTEDGLIARRLMRTKVDAGTIAAALQTLVYQSVAEVIVANLASTLTTPEDSIAAVEALIPATAAAMGVTLPPAP